MFITLCCLWCFKIMFRICRWIFNESFITLIPFHCLCDKYSDKAWYTDIVLNTKKNKWDRVRVYKFIYGNHNFNYIQRRCQSHRFFWRDEIFFTRISLICRATYSIADSIIFIAQWPHIWTEYWNWVCVKEGCDVTAHL